MYLHKDREMFRDIVEQTAEQSGRSAMVVEKDYYVTLILDYWRSSSSCVYLKEELLYPKDFM